MNPTVSIVLCGESQCFYCTMRWIPMFLLYYAVNPTVSIVLCGESHCFYCTMRWIPMFLLYYAVNPNVSIVLCGKSHCFYCSICESHCCYCTMWWIPLFLLYYAVNPIVSIVACINSFYLAEHFIFQNQFKELKFITKEKFLTDLTPYIEIFMKNSPFRLCFHFFIRFYHNGVVLFPVSIKMLLFFCSLRNAFFIKIDIQWNYFSS